MFFIALVTPGCRVTTGFCVLTGRLPAACVGAFVTETFVAAVELSAAVTSKKSKR